MAENYSVEIGAHLIEDWDGEADNKEAAFEAAKAQWAATIAAMTIEDVTIYDEDGDEV